ncbi:hypothetical protein BRC93_06545 [Halobacteriales archaeon QS_5_70_15]|nr:MAG: hypothetical protein BRC93_06545 [Halobacteriales archaeon QS_5_70_15]
MAGADPCRREPLARRSYTTCPGAVAVGGPLAGCTDQPGDGSIPTRTGEGDGSTATGTTGPSSTGAASSILRG